MWIKVALALAVIAGCILGIALSGLIIGGELSRLDKALGKLDKRITNQSVDVQRSSELYDLMLEKMDIVLKTEDMHWIWTRRWLNHLLVENNLGEFQFNAVPDELNTPTYVRPFEYGVKEND